MEFNKDLYQREYLCEWYFNKAYEEAYKWHIYYEYRCELYDKVVCTGETDRYGFIKPKSSEEFKLSNVNAFDCHKEMIDAIRQYNINAEEIITNDILQNAKQEVNKLTWSGVQMEYKRLFENVEI